MNISVHNSEDSGYIFHLSVNPFFKSDKKTSSKQWNFLTSDNLKSFGAKKSQYQNDIRDNHLDKPFRQLHYVLENSKNIRESDISEIFNAVTLDSFFDSLLKNKIYNTTVETSNKVPKQYNVQTSEIARIMVVKGLRYLTQSEKFKDNRETIKNVEAINHDFSLLSESFFYKAIEPIPAEQEKRIQDNPRLKKTIKKIKDNLDEIDAKSTISLDYPDNVNDSDFKNSLIEDREKTVKELFAIQNKIEYKKNNKEKKVLLEKQNKLRKHLCDLDETLDLFDSKKTLEHALLSLIFHAHRDLGQFLSNDEPISAKRHINHSKTILEKYQ